MRGRSHPAAASWVNREQLGDPASWPRRSLTIARQDPPPRRFIAGAVDTGVS